MSVSVEVPIAGIFHNSDCWKISEKTHICKKTFLEDYLCNPRFTSIARVHLKTPTTTLAGSARADIPSDLTQYLTQVMYSFDQLGFMHENCRKLFQLNLGPLYFCTVKPNKIPNEYIAILNGFLMSVHTIDS